MLKTPPTRPAPEGEGKAISRPLGPSAQETGFASPSPISPGAMVTVAVAGGTGGIGKHIVEGILETKQHDLIVLSRKPSCPDLEKLGARVVAVSYDDPSSLERALAGVHTVISTIAGTVYADVVTPQLALLDAACKAGVKRFAPSEFAGVAQPGDAHSLYGLKRIVADAVRKSGLEYTLFANGIFMNYLACGTPGMGYLHPYTYLFDVEGCKADLPGDGERYSVWTSGDDIGRFVAASLALEAWPEVSQILGDRKTLNEIVKIAEAVRGKRFEVKYTPLEEIKRQIVPEESNPLVHFFQQTLVSFLETERMAFTEGNLNQLCPQVKPIEIDEFLKTWWGKA